MLLKFDDCLAMPALEYAADLFSLIFLALYLLASPPVKAFVPVGVVSILPDDAGF